MNILRLCLVLLMLAGLAAPASAEGRLWDSGDTLTGQVLVDPSGQMGPDEALNRLRAGAGQNYSPKVFYPTSGSTAVWFLLDVPAQQRASSVLLIPYPGLNSLRLYEAGSGGTPWRVLAAGDDLPVANWAVPHLFPAMPL